MTALAGTSPLQRFPEFLADQARSLAAAPGAGGKDLRDLRRDLDAMLAVAVAWYEELRRSTREATTAADGQPLPADAATLARLREAHARYSDACRPVLKLIEQARAAGAEPRRLDAFMGTVGEARLIAEQYDRVVAAERQADEGRTRPLAEVRGELRRRVHARSG